MLTALKRDLTQYAKMLAKPYESYSIDELANAYCDAKDNNNNALKDVYYSALYLRFWYVIDKLYKANTMPCLNSRVYFADVLHDAIEYACKYRGWRDPNKKLNAQQCINKCVSTIMLQKYYDLRLDKNKAINYCSSLDAPIGGDGEDSSKTIGDTIECPNSAYDTSTTDMTILIQGYINRNKIIEAILLDNIAFNDAQRYHKRTVTTTNTNGEPYKYTEYSSEFWPYKLVQIVSKLPDTYKSYFLDRYDITKEKLDVVLDVIKKANNQKLYRYLRHTLAELKEAYSG